MYKVMIVDDEPLIREGLKTIVDWEAHGFRVAGTAADGLDALEKAPEIGPDLIIVDVRMPGMDGLQFIRALQERRPGAPPRILILSGHADFEYARQAMTLRAEGYLLKPVDEDELSAALHRLKEALDDDRRTGNAKPDAAAWTRERIAAAILSGEDGQVPEAAIRAADQGGGSFELLLVKPLSREEIDAESSARVRRELEAGFERTGRGFLVSADPYLALVLTEEAGQARAHSAAYREIEAACAASGLDFIVVSGGTATSVRELGRPFREARELMSRRFVLEGGRIHGPEERRKEAAEPAEAPDLEAAGERLLLALDAGNAEAASALIDSVGAAMLEADMAEPAIKAGFAQLLTTALGKLAQTRPEHKASCQSLATEALDIYAEYRYSGMLNRLLGLVREAAEELRSYGGDQQVQRMIELIRRNYRENLKLESLAEALSYNSSYLGKLFKNATGESFNTYLDKVRIEKAKELLGEGMKVYQVAERVGYSNVDYFHGKFRKYVGVSPSAYRKH